MLERVLNVLLIVLVIVGFFFGVRVGKNIQKADTPERVVYKKATDVQLIGIRSYSLSSCVYSFALPSSVSITVSSQSAVIKQGKNSLSVSCPLTPVKNSVATITTPQGKEIYITGTTNMWDSLKTGFLLDDRYKLSHSSL